MEAPAAAFYSGKSGGSREWVVRPRRTGLRNLLADLWDYRGIFGFIAARAILDNSRKPLLGAAWLVIRPAVTVGVAVYVVSKVFEVPTGSVPNVLFAIISLSLWRLFSAGMRYGTRALTKGRALIRRVNFPRIMLLLGALVPALIEFAVVFVGALGILAFYAYKGIFVPTAGWHVLVIFPAILLVILFVQALSSITSVLNNIASDAAATVNYAASFLLLLTPVIYPFSVIPPAWQPVFLLNPLAPAFEMWRSALLGMAPPPAWSIALAFASAGGLFIAGLLFFQRWEQTILDKS